MTATIHIATPGADESARLLARRIFERKPLLFTKFGDAEIRWALQFGDQQAEGERGNAVLGAKMLAAWETFGRHPHTYLGDWQTASFQPGDETRYEGQWAELCWRLLLRPTFVHYESLLLMRLSDALRDFYRVIATDRRRKVLIAPARLAGAANLLRAHHVIVPLEGASSLHETIVDMLLDGSFFAWDVALFCSGRSAKFVMAELCQTFPERTYIDLGSAMDPLFGFQTRSLQVSTRQAWEYFAGLW